jgi:hypothetical protein
VFTVDESATDYHVTFVEHFPINTSNATNTFRVTRGLETFEINIYLNGSNTRYKGYVYVSIEILTSQQETVDLLASFGIQASDGAWNKLELPFSVLAVHDTITYNLTLLDNVMKEANKVHNGSGVFTIRMAASYLITVNIQLQRHKLSLMLRHTQVSI